MHHTNPSVLIVEDDPIFAEILKSSLHDWNYAAVITDDGEKAQEWINSTPFEIVLLDLMLPGKSGLEILEATANQPGSPEFIVMTVDQSVDTVVQAIKLGALDFLPKPLNFDYLEILLNRTLERRRQQLEAHFLRSQLLEKNTFEGMVGVCPAMQIVYERIRRGALTHSPVLISGETGTGKELVARAIHNLRSSPHGQFLAINCGAVPDDLLESELFGHEKGAFTGATTSHRGLLERAAEGTLFLDDIQQMSAAMQGALLRAVEEKEIRRVGSTKSIHTDFHLLSSTNVPLKELIAHGQFREDLFFRISTLPIDLPPLRERGEDIPLLAEHFLNRRADELSRPVRGFTPEAMSWMKSFRWPGNVRQLQQTLERALVFGNGEKIALEDLTMDIGTNQPAGSTPLHPLAPLKKAREDFERRYLISLLEMTNGNCQEAARHAGLNRQYFYQKMERLRIRLPHPHA